MTADFGKDSVISDKFDQPLLFLPLLGVDRSVSSLTPLFLFFRSSQGPDQQEQAWHLMAEADFLDWSAALTWEDDRKDYSEIRRVALLPMADRLYCCVYVEREEAKRIISLRKANQREFDHYAENID